MRTPTPGTTDSRFHLLHVHCWWDISGSTLKPSSWIAHLHTAAASEDFWHLKKKTEKQLFISLMCWLTEIPRKGWARPSPHSFCSRRVPHPPRADCRGAGPKPNFMSMCTRAYLQFILLMFLLTPKKSSEWIFGGRRTLESNKGWGLRF